MTIEVAGEALHQFGIAAFHEPDGSGDSWVVMDWYVTAGYYRRQIRLDLGFHASEEEARAIAKAAARAERDA